ncbi:MAG: hypothetical protein ABI947_04375 [Chloroflexota bacterium]
MSNQPPDNQSSNKKSIKDEIQRRKTEQIGRDVEARRNTQTTRPVPPSSASASSSTSTKITSPQAGAQAGRNIVGSAPDPDGSSNNQTMIFAAIGVIIVLVVLGIGFVAFSGNRNTPVPTAQALVPSVAVQGDAATQDSNVGPSVAGNVTLATLVPRTPETATPFPSDTPAPSKTPTIPPTTSTDATTPAPTNADLAQALPTTGPTITPSGPIVQAEVSNSKAFNSAAPTSVGRLSLDPKTSITDVHGSTLVYVTETGQQYTVVLWLTNSAQEALDRYRLDISGLDGAQPIHNIGDEGVIAGPKNQIVAEIRDRNTVLIVYRPVASSTVPSQPLTSDETLTLLKALYASIPH